MGALSSLRTTGGALSRNPVVFVGAFLVALLSVLTQAPQFVVRFVSNPALSVLVGLLVPILAFFVTPFLSAGLFGMATEAIAGETSLGTFVRVGRARYVALLLASLLYAVLAFAFAIVFVIVTAIVVFAVGIGFGGGGDPSIAAIALVVLVVFVLVLAFVLFAFFLQFYAVAVVIEEAGVTESFTRSYRLVRRNLLSTLGYDVLTVLVSLLVAIPFIAVVGAAVFLAGGTSSTAVTTPAGAGTAPFESGELPVAVLAVGAVGFLVLQTLTSAITRTYAVAFYRDRRAPEEATDSDARGSNRQPAD